MATRPWPLRFTATAVVAACLGLLGQDAHALALGRITVQSALGEPLRAEIEVPDINPDEAGSLRAALGSAEAFRRAGLEYNSVLSGVQVSLQRRADGRAYLRLRSDRVINEPFLDLVIEAKWSAGQLVRDYTLLFDPPLARQNAVTPSVTTAPVMSPQAAGAAIAAARPAPVLAQPPAMPAAPGTPPVAMAKAPPSAPKSPPSQATATSAVRAKTPAPSSTSTAPRDDKQVTVRTGDTASKIANAIKPTTVSLDQMLVALLRTNPNAFTAGNVNRLKAGAVLDMPSADAATATPAGEASQMVVAQSRDFNDFRRKLASGVTVAQVDAPKRTSSGKVQAQIQDKKPSDASPDKLSLQKGELKGKAVQDKIAKDLRDNDAAKRLAELNKNISDLSKLSTPPASPALTASATAAPKAMAPASAPATTLATLPAVVSSAVKATVTTPVVTVPTVTPTTAPTLTPTTQAITATATAPVTATPTTSVASAPVAVASAPAMSASAPVAPKPATPASGAEASVVSDLLENPLVPAAAGGLVALLAGLGFYKYRQRRKNTQVDSSFMESRLQPDSFFGSSGGHKIDTTDDAGQSGSSMMYSPSQLDAGADVDPVAEADVYLAYGRDLQAEEILKEALRINPSRAAIHFKLLQIYAKRQDVKAYAASATDAYKLTQGLGPDWSTACEAGRMLDPTNPLYQGDNISSFADLAALSAAVAAPFAATTLPFTATDTAPLTIEAPASDASFDLDLDLDFSATDHVATPDARADTAPPDFSASTFFDNPSAADRTASLQAKTAPLPASDLVMEFDTPDEPAPTAPPALPELDFDVPAPAVDAGNALDFTHSDLVELLNTPTGPASVSADLPHPDKNEMMAFDLDSLSLDLDTPPVAATETAEAVDDDLSFPEDAEADGADPLVTKLALAEEFQAIGDDDGARTLAQEVVDEATGNLKIKAQRFLAELG